MAKIDKTKMMEMALYYFSLRPLEYVRTFGTTRVVRATYLWKQKIDRKRKEKADAKG